jgi:hypothetical protein
MYCFLCSNTVKYQEMTYKERVALRITTFYLIIFIFFILFVIVFP